MPALEARRTRAHGTAYGLYTSCKLGCMTSELLSVSLYNGRYSLSVPWDVKLVMGRQLASAPRSWHMPTPGTTTYGYKPQLRHVRPTCRSRIALE